MKRRELFSSLGSSFQGKYKQEKTIRPPYFKEEKLFFINCINCDGKCSIVCEENIIFIRKDKTPILDFTQNGCSYCDECAKACEYEVLNLKNKKEILAKIDINVETCLSWNQTMCFSCKDPCLDEAIDFLAMFRPSINDNCTSCGYCIKVCPTNAIKIKEISRND